MLTHPNTHTHTYHSFDLTCHHSCWYRHVGDHFLIYYYFSTTPSPQASSSSIFLLLKLSGWRPLFHRKHHHHDHHFWSLFSDGTYAAEYATMCMQIRQDFLSHMIHHLHRWLGFDTGKCIIGKIQLLYKNSGQNNEIEKMWFPPASTVHQLQNYFSPPPRPPKSSMAFQSIDPAHFYYPM